MSIRFQIGDKAVYPGRGVAEIKSIQEKTISGVQYNFYSLYLEKTGITVMVPEKQLVAHGVRPVIDEDGAGQILEELRKKEILKPKNTKLIWKKRVQLYTDKINTGCLFQTVEVLRELLYLKEIKTLSYSEQQIFETAQFLLSEEISIATGQQDILNSFFFTVSVTEDETTQHKLHA